MFDTCWLIPIIGSNKTFFSAMTRKNVVRSVSPFFDWFPYDDHEQKQEHIIIRCHPTQMGKSRWRPKWDADGAGSMKNQKIEQSVVVFFQKRSNSRIQIRIVMIYYFRFFFSNQRSVLLMLFHLLRVEVWNSRQSGRWSRLCGAHAFGGQV
jgi:hypothetical protein